jgi:hypothetical protein
MTLNPEYFETHLLNHKIEARDGMTFASTIAEGLAAAVPD